MDFEIFTLFWVGVLSWATEVRLRTTALDCCGKSGSPLVHALIAESMHDLLESQVPGT